MNNTEVLIDSINITSSNNNSNPDYLQLGPGQSQTYYYDMTDLPKVDGHYILTYRDSTNHSSRFGYFSNGFPMEKVTNVFFEKDTVVIDQIFNKL